MSKFTPGPWTVGTPNDGYNANQVYAPNGDGICQVYGIWMHRNVDEVAGCDGLPNARLIAAAPALYEAATAAVRHMRLPGSEPLIAIPESAYKALKAALRLADGEDK